MSESRTLEAIQEPLFSLDEVFSLGEDQEEEEED